ncbi:MAG: lysylphosphatidylglycerol synthase transmembrane domain-containing protein [Bacteroidota bacterium]
MNLDTAKILKTLNPNKIWFPALISLGFVAFMVYTDDDFTPQKLNLVFEARALPIILAFVALLAKEGAYIYRIRTLTNKELSWTSSVYVTIIWEFASAVTPSVVGGTAVATFILLKEGINLGKSLAYVMLTAILDNLFFVVSAPIVLLFLGTDLLPNFTGSLQGIFITSYLLIAIYTLIMSFALFYRPRIFKWLLIKITSIPFLRKWRYAAYQYGNEVMWASSLIRGRKKRYWAQIIMATIVAWVARYVILNFLIAAYNGDITFMEHIRILGKNLILWIVMLLSPTPGGSGTAEHFFIQFFEGYLGSFTLGTTLLWRLITYYTYLIVGALVLPRWIRKAFFKKKALA